MKSNESRGQELHQSCQQAQHAKLHSDLSQMAPPVDGAQGYQTFPLCKPVVGQNVALYSASADRTSIYQRHYINFISVSLNLPSCCLPESFNFIPPQTCTVINKNMCHKH